MSTILIQKEYEPRNTAAPKVSRKKLELESTQSSNFAWKDLAGLSWIGLDDGDEI